jgi:hypothetical protein
MHEQWTNFYLGEVGAAAALTGLFFVAVSINILNFAGDRTLSGRAAETIAMLLGSLVTASLMLVPEQSPPWLGVELLLVAVVIWIVPAHIQLKDRKKLPPEAATTFPQRVLISQLATVPAIIAGGLLIADLPAGYAVLAIGILATFGVAVVNAWVLLVEILR